MVGTEPSSAGNSAEPETWDYLARTEKQRRLMQDDIQRIHENCPKDPGHRIAPVSKCKDCYYKSIDRINQRYLGSLEGEWYADRRIFIQHLTELIAAVRRGESSLDAIEDRVMDEKRKWFREGVKNWAATFAKFGLAEKRDELLRLHDDRTLEFAEFCNKVQKVVELNIESCPPDSLRRLLNLKSKKSERAEAYIQIFFFPTDKPEVIMESTQRYLRMLDQGTSMRRIMAMMVEDRRQYVGHSAEVDAIKQRIDDLQKAKATFQKQQQAKKQRKDKKASGPERGPPCAVCGTTVELQHRICPVCEISFSYGVAKQPHPYCSENCQSADFSGHVEAAHQCHAGDNCLQLYEDVVPDVDGHFCKQCLHSSTSAALYCSIRCAEVNHTNHREGGEGREEARQAFLSIAQVFQELQDEETFASYTLAVPRTNAQLVSVKNHTTTKSNTMDGLETQSVDQQARLSVSSDKQSWGVAESVQNDLPNVFEMTETGPATLGQAKPIDQDIDTMDADERLPSPQSKSTSAASGYQWDQTSRESNIPITHTSSKIDPRHPILPEVDKKDYSHGKSPTAEPRPGGVTELFPEKVRDAASRRPGSGELAGPSEGKPGSANIPTAGAGAPAEKVVDHSRRSGGPGAGRRPDETRSGFPAQFGNRADPRRDPPRKGIALVDSQYTRIRHEDKRRPFDQDSPSRNDDYRKRKAEFLHTEPRQFEQNNKDPKRARSGSDELEEGEI